MLWAIRLPLAKHTYKLLTIPQPASPSPFAGGRSSGSPKVGTSPATSCPPAELAIRPDSGGGLDGGLAALPSPTGTRNTMMGPFSVALAYGGSSGMIEM